MINDERLLPLSKAPQYFPSPVRPHVGTVVRWALKGVGRTRRKLETLKIGGRRFTSREAIQRFVALLSGETCAYREMSQQRGDKIMRAQQELDAEGIV